MKTKEILVVGSLNVDMVINLEKIPVVGETVLCDNYHYSLGGKGANQACAAGKLDGCVKMLGCVGNDDFGKKQIASLQQINVDTSAIKISQTEKTGTAFVAVNKDGNNSIIVSAGANNSCDVDYIKSKKSLIEQAEIIVAQLEIPYEAVLELFKEARKLNKTIILDPAPYSEKISEELLSLVDYITPNETELMSLVKSDSQDFSLESMIEKAKIVLESGVKNVLVTLGKRGTLLINKEFVKSFSVEDVKTVDTTAAGDCFTGAFAVALSEGKSVDESIEFAGKASTIAVTRVGAQVSLPKRCEINS